MASTAIQGDLADDSENEGPLETDPSSRYQRCDEILGEGAYKVVYKACNLEEGNEVAWNQLRIDNLSKREAQKILSEIEILQSIRNEHIINFYSSWLTSSINGGERIVFITELMHSGTLKQYLKKTLKGALKPKVVKAWSRQILQGLCYLHARDPPIIHRDLKCDNIFINGNNGQLKIGDLGLAVVRRRTHVSSVLGTPEFMAPELYDEKYNEKVDIYAFGMCVLEMVTKDYPYAECTNQAQIYRKVSQGIKPIALDQIQDLGIKGFIDRCLDHNPSTRPSAQELLDSDFLKPCLSENDSSLTPTSPPTQPLSHPHITIPSAEFTLVSVDAVKKTYHIRTNLLPLTPTSPHHDSSLPLGQTEQTDKPSSSPIDSKHSHHHHTNSEICSIQVVQYGEPTGSRLNLKMICTCPVSGDKEGSASATGTHEIKFPFDLQSDTVDDVVAEMIREQILSAEDKQEAVSRMNGLVKDILRLKSAAIATPILNSPPLVASAATTYTNPVAPQQVVHPSQPTSSQLVPQSIPQPIQQPIQQPALRPIQPVHQSIPPPVQQLITSQPTQLLSQQLAQSTLNQQLTQPPLQQITQQSTQSAQSTQSTQQPHKTSSTPLVFPSGQILQTPPRPKSVHDLSIAAMRVMPRGLSADSINTTATAMKSQSSLSAAKSHERQRSTSTTAAAFMKEDDIGYTSPFRHTTSSSSIKSHKRTPSCDTSSVISNALSIPTSFRMFYPPTEAPGTGRHRAQSDLGQFNSSSPNFSSLLTQSVNKDEVPSIASVVQLANVSAVSSNTVPQVTDAKVFDTPKNTPMSKGEETDSGISSGASSPASMGLGDTRSSGQQQHSSGQRHSSGQITATMPLQVPIPQKTLLSPQMANRTPLHGQTDEVMHPMSSSISSDGSFQGIMMTNEAMRGIEMWSNNVQRTSDQQVPTGEETGQRPNGVYQEQVGSVSTSWENENISDDEEQEIVDPDLLLLRENQRKEMERMRLQHEQEWEQLVKFKEKKDKTGIEARVRRVSESHLITRLDININNNV
ncbi:hypothetical protein BGZ76_003044 [Entomortierella beljakovae]|nr:hypothetical protein BGZ76_003044 [Entomortierella beljakovae]